MKKQMRVRLLSLVLSALMVMSALPTTAFAAEPDAAEPGSAQTQVFTEPTAEPDAPAAEPEEPAQEDEEPAEEPAAEPAEPQAEPEENGIAVQDAEGGTLQFSKDVNEGPHVYPYGQWAYGPTLEVKVGTYTPVGGTATAIPSSSYVSYQWYYSEDDTASDDDPKIDYQNNTSYRVRCNYIGMRYFYARATVTIDGVTYNGVSKLAAVKVKAADAKVTLTVNDKGVFAADKDGNAVCNTTVTVSDIDEDGKLTYDEALIAAHKALMSESDYATKDGMVTKFWGVETANLLFYNNGKALATKVNEAEVKANNKLYVSFLKDDKYYSDQFATFDVNTKSIAEGVEFDLTLKDADGKALSGIEVGTWDKGAFVPYEGKVTDENGKVTLSFDTEGVYNVTAKGTVKAEVTTDWSAGTKEEMDCTLMAPACTVTVKKLGEIRFGPKWISVKESGKFGDNPYTYKVGETNTFYDMLYAYYYGADGKQVSSISTTTTWYRIGANSAVPEKVTNISAAFTAADIGTWQYYMYAECNAYGVKVGRRTNFATVVVSEAGPIESSTKGGYITKLLYDGEELDLSKTEFEVTKLDNGSGAVKMFVKPSEIWFGIRVNGILDSSCGEDTQYAITSWRNGWSKSLPSAFKVGSVNTVSYIAGPKYDSNQDGEIDKKDAFLMDECDVYNFTVTTLPSLSAFSVSDADGNSVTMDPEISWSNKDIRDSYGACKTDKIKLTATFKHANGVKLYINDKVYEKSLSGEELDLTSFRDAKGVANIPLRTVYETTDGKTLENTTTLHLSKTSETLPVITKQPDAAGSCFDLEKDTSTKLSVEAEKPTDGSTLSYQWIWNNYKINDFDDGRAVDGATDATFEAKAEAEATDYKYDSNGKYYACIVTRTGPDGAVSKVLSNYVQIRTKLTYVNKPVFSIQPGLSADAKGHGVYRTEYQAGSRFDPMFLGVQCHSDSERVDGKFLYYDVTEYGCNEFTLKCFYNTEPSYEGATEIPITLPGGGTTGGDYGWYSNIVPTVGLPEGTYYVFVEATSTAKDDETKSASSYSDFVKLTFTKAELGFEGSGVESDPFQLKTADDFVKIQKLVNEGGQTLSGMYFKMMNDITLPEDWIPIGYKETIDFNNNDLYFGGTLDGGGHQLSYAKHSQPLIMYASQAVIKNLRLYGEEIQGCGLINGSWLDPYPRATIQNVTLVSGTSTLRSGLTTGGAKAANTTTFINCHAEEGVIIGYTKDKSSIATFASGLMGTMEGCTSAATVYGVDEVGGLAAYKGNSMATCRIKNCSFTGKIEATGQFIGGIMAQGYYAVSAPNATCVDIENCYVNADITGKDAVGGIFGGEKGVDQCWSNGIGDIRNNLFYGSLTATGDPTTENLGGSKGGIIGFMRSLNKYNNIVNNYFYDKNGCEKAIGGVEHIDTSAKPFGLSKDDNIFYYDTSKDDLSKIKDFVDAEDKGTSDWNYTSVSQTDHNRTDDPMGKDAAKLGKPCTTTEMTDGTVLKLLNEHEDSLKNWEQGESFPLLSNKATVSSLTLSGNYKTEYYIGEKLDMTGAVFTVHWSDGSTTTPSLDDVKIEGFDSSSRAVLTLKASYSGAEVEFQVKVIKKSSSSTSDIKVSFTLLGDDKHGDLTEETGTHTLKRNNLKTWLEKKTYTVDENATVWDVMQQIEKETDGLSFSNPKGNYVDKITFNGLTLGEFDNGTYSGWMYTLNGKHPLLGVSEQFLNSGDSIVFHYTDDYREEEGSEPWHDENYGGGGGGSTVNAGDQKAANTVIDQIKAIGDVTKDSGDKIKAARDAYDKLTEAQKKLVTNYGTLTDAERAYAGLTGKLPFTDVNGHWAYDAIKYAYENSLFAGTSATTFGPNVSMNRAMLVTVLYRLDKEPSAETTSSFKDVPAGQWYTKAVAWASANKIVSGYDADTFGPTDTITREQMASILYRYAEYKGYDVSKTTDLAAFTDKASVSDWALTSMQWANAEKLINGRTATTLVPQGNATRAEVAQILMTFAENVAK